MTIAQLYLFMVILPNLHEFTSSPILFIPIFALIGGVTAVIAGTVNDEPAVSKIGGRSIKYAALIFSILSISFCISPSNSQIYTMAGGYAATNTKDIAKLPDNIVKAANAWLEKAAALADDKKPTK